MASALTVAGDTVAVARLAGLVSALGANSGYGRDRRLHHHICDRVHQQTTSGFDDNNATIKQYMATRTANAFNWVLLNAGSGTHKVEVKATLYASATSNASAQAGIGKRTLVVTPERLQNSATI